ncbi:hypothetical protein FACS1894201_09420 [Bacteroidia bacterium]|nr:hypothetical protein FACS1894201_09420 [Bacteroidia bacterium]
MRLYVVNKNIVNLLSLSLFFFGGSLSAQVTKASVDMEICTLSNGKTLTTKAEVYYQVRDNRLVTHFTQPTESVLITNNKGEVQNYDVNQNTVFVYHNSDLASTTNTLFFFLNGQTQNLGLHKIGFRLLKTHREDSLVVSEWEATNPLNTIQKVNLVYDHLLPIYIDYFDKNGKLLKKAYFSDYYTSKKIYLPQKITEISYLENTDSLITQTFYRNIKEESSANSVYFDYAIPGNAKTIQGCHQTATNAPLTH